MIDNLLSSIIDVHTWLTLGGQILQEKLPTTCELFVSCQEKPLVKTITSLEFQLCYLTHNVTVSELTHMKVSRK